MTGSVDHAIKRLDGILQFAKCGPLSNGDAMRVCVDLAETLMTLLTSASPLPHKRPLSIELYTADEHGRAKAFIMSLPMPDPFPSIVTINANNGPRWFAYCDRSNVFIEADPYRAI